MAKITSEFAVRVFPPKLKQITMAELVEMPLGTVYITTNMGKSGTGNTLLYYVGLWEPEEGSVYIKGVSPYNGENKCLLVRENVPVLILDEGENNGN